MLSFKSLLIGAGLVLLALGVLVACSPVATLNAFAPRDTHRLSEGVAYGAQPRERLDIHTPTSAPPPGGFPVVVFFYGGSWNRGERADYRFVGEALASRGMLTMVADYRLYPEVRWPEFLVDSAKALAFALERAHALGGDPKRVYVMGHSAGAYNAAMLAFDARWLRATGHDPAELAGFIGLAGAYDFLPMTNPETRPVFFHPDYPSGTQPIVHAGAQAPRSFVGAAASDTLIDPQRNSGGLARRLQSLQVPVTLRWYERVNHMTLVAALARPLRWLAPVLADVQVFVAADQRGSNGAR